MPQIVANQTPIVGEEFVIRANLLSKVGSCFSIVFNGVRVGVARVVRDYHSEKQWTREKHGGGLTNLAFHKYGIKVERIFGDDDDE